MPKRRSVRLKADAEKADARVDVDGHKTTVNDFRSMLRKLTPEMRARPMLRKLTRKRRSV